MAYSHFCLLYRNAPQNERKRAQYMAFAFNDPKRLFDGAPEAKVKVSKLNVGELLLACNPKPVKSLPAVSEVK